MLKAFYSISKKAQKKDIYIYGITRDSVTVFTNLALWGGDIRGFVDDVEERYIGEYFMNRPIIAAESVKSLKNVIVIVSKAIGKNVVKERVGEDIELFFYDEIIEPNKELGQKDVYIYGIGKYGEKVYEQCCEHGINVKAACVTRKERESIWNGLPVFEISEIDTQKDCNFILATIQPVFQQQMMETLVYYNGDKYIYNYMFQHHVSEGRFFQIIGKAVSEQKKIWLYGKNLELKAKVEEIFSRYSVKIQGQINNLYDLAYDAIDDIVVVITDIDEYDVEQACDVLDSLGFALEHWNYTSLACETIKCKDRVKTSPDMLLSWSNISNNRDYPGFIVYGNNNRQDIKIMVLGGSTSTDGIYRTESWVKLFYEKLLSANYQATIFNGAACGHGITRELLHLLRDGAYMELDYIISLSGVNNVVDHGIKNHFSDDLGKENTLCIYGLESKESLYEYWYRNIEIMKRVAELYGSKFYSFLQPMKICQEASLFETTMHEVRNSRKGILEFRYLTLQETKSIYINTIDFLDKKADMYIDNVHYSSLGNRLIADMIYDTILKEEGVLKKYHVKR